MSLTNYQTMRHSSVLPPVDRCLALSPGKAPQSKADRIHHNQCLQSLGCGSRQPWCQKTTKK